MIIILVVACAKAIFQVLAQVSLSDIVIANHDRLILIKFSVCPSVCHNNNFLVW